MKGNLDIAYDVKKKIVTISEEDSTVSVELTFEGVEQIFKDMAFVLRSHQFGIKIPKHLDGRKAK
jgi:hypothetical protein